jgi:hypothetical protein
MSNPMLTVSEIAEELRCCKAQVHRLLGGKVSGVPRLPSIALGRKKVVRRSSLESWKQQNEAQTNAIIPPAEDEPVGA